MDHQPASEQQLRGQTFEDQIQASRVIGDYRGVVFLNVQAYSNQELAVGSQS